MGGGPPGPGGMGPGEKPKNFKATFGKLMQYLSGYKASLLIVMIVAICSTIFSIVGPKILGNATTEIFNGMMGKLAGTSDGIDFTAIGNILITLVIIYLISASFSLLQGLIMSTVTNRITFQLRNDIDKKIFKLPFSYYDRVSTGDVLSRLTNDVDTINQGLNQSVTQFVTSITSLIGIAIMMLTISIPMTLITLISLPVSMFVIMLIAKLSQKHFKNQQKYLGLVNGIAEETYSCHTIVHAFNGEEDAKVTFQKNNNILYHSAWKANFLSGLMMPLMNFIGNLSYVVICIVGGYYASIGRITIGNIQAFIQYMKSFTQPIAQLSQMSNVIQQTIAAAERVFEFLEEQEELAERENPIDASQIQGAVEFQNVNFGYIKDKIIVNDFNATIQPGQKVAIVGPTGAGKTTMIKLLMRFYDVNSGAILIDGHNLKDYNRSEIRQSFGMVLQETWLFGGSIEDNIRYGKLDATKEEVERAATMAQANHFIRTLPNGYQMKLNEEASNVSQGQKQLLTIARAILADPKILILDEATSSIDTRTELLIQKAMDNLMEGRTSFVIAHRLSTIRNADLILVMKDGDIIEQGTHNDLLSQDGFYASLYNSQFAKTS
ncbi:MAG: ABC transporter ATP-binding protein [Eubacteriales bacterium]